MLRFAFLALLWAAIFGWCPVLLAAGLPSAGELRSQVDVPTFRGNGHVIVVFGEKMPDGKMGPILQKRMERALELAKRYPDARIIVSGGSARSTHGKVEADEMKEWLVEALGALERAGPSRERAMALAGARIIVEDEAQHTVDNAEKTIQKLVELSKTEDVKLVTLDTVWPHAGRTVLAYRGKLREAALKHPELAKVKVNISGAPDPEIKRFISKSNKTELYKFWRGIVFAWHEGDIRARSPIKTMVEIGTASSQWFQSRRRFMTRPVGIGNLKPRGHKLPENPESSKRSERMMGRILNHYDYEGRMSRIVDRGVSGSRPGH